MQRVLSLILGVPTEIWNKLVNGFFLFAAYLAGKRAKSLEHKARDSYQKQEAWKNVSEKYQEILRQRAYASDPSLASSVRDHWNSKGKP